MAAMICDHTYTTLTYCRPLRRLWRKTFVVRCFNCGFRMIEP